MRHLHFQLLICIFVPFDTPQIITRILFDCNYAAVILADSIYCFLNWMHLWWLNNQTKLYSYVSIIYFQMYFVQDPVHPWKSWSMSMASKENAFQCSVCQKSCLRYLSLKQLNVYLKLANDLKSSLVNLLGVRSYLFIWWHIQWLNWQEH